MNSYGYRCLKPTEISTALYIKSPGWVSKLTVATPLQVWSKHEELPRHCGPQSGHEEVWTWKKIDPNGTALWLGKDKTWQCRKKSQNESGCFYLFLSVPLSFWCSQQTLILLYCYTFILLDIKIIYCSTCTSTSTSWSHLSWSRSAKNSPLWTLQRRGGQRWDKDPDDDLKDQVRPQEWSKGNLRLWLL